MNVQIATAPLHDAAVDLLVLGTSDKFAEELSGLDARYGGHLLPLLQQRKFTGKAGSAALIPSLGRIAARDVLILGLGDRSAATALKAAGKAGRQARDSGARSVALGFGATAADERVILENFAAGNHSYDTYKPESDRTPAVETLFLGHDPGTAVTEAASIRAKWQNFARDLVSAPAADIYPETLATEARKLAALPDVTVEVWDLARLKQEKCVGIIAVGQGSSNEPRLIHVRYRPANAKAHVALVGKGVTFDSGGLSLKPSNSMQTMRCDMGGAATVLGAIAIAAESRWPVAVDAIIGAVENMNSGNSYKLGDVLAYRNGVTVEIHNTDAEGRLVLADCLINACKEPGVTDVVDVATLTGAVVVAIGPDFTGLYTGDDTLAKELSDAAAFNGEGLWRMPLHDGYRAWLKGDWAQLKNVSGKPDAGATTAALFLQYFVTGARWAHLDIAGSAFAEKANGFYAPGGTGQMVRSLASWIQSRA